VARIALSLPLALLLAFAAAAARAAPDGFVPARSAAKRARAYLRFATSEIAKGSILNAIAHMERDVVDRRYDAPEGAVDVGDWSATWDELDHLRDTRDFDALYLVVALLGYEHHPYLTPALWERIRQSLLSFKTWYTDPTPPQPDPADPERDYDDSYYWSENHQVLYHAIEYLAGQRFPGECFWISGFERTADCTGPGEMTGNAHLERARGFLRRWMDDRWEAGFSEWLSNVYYQKDAVALLALAEFAEEPEIATRAAILLDVLLLDVATHLHQNTFGATHGRSYMKDAYRGLEDDTWNLSLVLFHRRGRPEFTSVGDPAVLFARAERYRLPEPIDDAANDRGPSLARTRQSFFVDERGPIVPDPEHPPGHSFEESEANFTFWWGLGAHTIWQVVPLTVLGGDAYDLWDTTALRDYKALRESLGDPPDLALGQSLAVDLAPGASAPLLREANTYTWRTREFMLSTVQDWRKGHAAAQVLAWQATLGPEAVVFTTHPAKPVQPPSAWVGREDGSPGYWTGTASMPRSAQHENVAIHVYSPAYPDGGFLGYFDYEPMTHAYFPRDRFDDVVRDGHWVFARKGRSYIALYSWRETEWQEYPPEELDRVGGGLRRSFDLVAPGGPDNVWIVECGRRSRLPEPHAFFIFRSQIAAARLRVTPQPTEQGHQTFDVVYDSPSQGRIHFGWDGPLEVRRNEVPLDGYPRTDNPFVTAERGDSAWTVSGRRTELALDWAAGTRSATRRRP
jgi:hypothetical protein